MLDMKLKIPEMCSTCAEPYFIKNGKQFCECNDVMIIKNRDWYNLIENVYQNGKKLEKILEKLKC